MKVSELREFLEKCPQDVDVKFWVFRDCTPIRTEVEPHPKLMRYHPLSDAVTIDVDIRCKNVVESTYVNDYYEFKRRKNRERNLAYSIPPSSGCAKWHLVV